MYKQQIKTKEKKSQSVANAVSPRHNSHAPTSRFVDNRPEAIQAKKLRKLEKISPQNDKLREYHHLATANSVAQNKGEGQLRFGLDGKTNVIQRKTHITHKTKQVTYSGKKDEVGIEMQAWLDPNRPVVGSSTGTPQLALFNAVNYAAGSTPMIRGHLLNHDLGGFGVAYNLYPITSQANAKHKVHVENPVGQALKDQVTASGAGIYYSVKVKNAKNTAAQIGTSEARFMCKAQKVKNMTASSVGDLHGPKILETEIKSKPNADNQKNRGTAIEKSGPLKSAKKEVLSTWDHHGRAGMLNFLSIFTHTAAGPNHEGKAIQIYSLKEISNPAEAAALVDEHNRSYTRYKRVHGSGSGGVVGRHEVDPRGQGSFLDS